MSDLASQFKKTMMAYAFLEHVDQLLTMAHMAAVVGMMVSALAVTSASNTAKHPVGALAVARGEGRSKGCRGKKAANHRDIQEAGPSIPKAAAGSVARGLVTSPQLATTPRNKGKGKAKAQDKEDKDIEEQIEETFTNKHLATLLHWQKASTVVDTGLGAGQSNKSISTCKECVTTAEPIMTQRAAGTPQGQSLRSTGGKFTKKIAMKAALVRNARAFIEQQQELEVMSGSSGGTKAKSKEWVESDENGASPASVATAKRPQMVASEEGEGDVEMREITPLATVAAVEQEESDMEVEGKKEFEAAPAAIEEDKVEEQVEEVKVQRRGTWSDTPLRQVGSDELEWLGEDLGWPTLLMSAVLLADFDKRAAGVEQWFQRELEAARKELLVAQAHYTVAK
ncbi:hypothetical protein E4T56_gene532 [Termitomyces sp. T112]|nr:hypothetical protein E4T56_gene532 [Termitomyces sp. T112]